MRKFELTIKERCGSVLHPSYVGDVDEAFLVDFFGLGNPDVESYEIKELCCLCGREISGYGHSAEPLSNGRCCTECNTRRVIPYRINLLEEPKKNK